MFSKIIAERELQSTVSNYNPVERGSSGGGGSSSSIGVFALLVFRLEMIHQLSAGRQGEKETASIIGHAAAARAYETAVLTHTYAHKDGFPYLPVSLSHSINPDTAAGTGADKQQVGSQQGCVSVTGGWGEGGCWEILFYLQVMLSQDLLSRSSVAYWHEPMNCKCELHFFFHCQARPMEGFETQMQKGIKTDYLEHLNHSVFPLLKQTVPNIFNTKTAQCATSISPATRGRHSRGYRERF